MDVGAYIAASGAISSHKILETIAHNVANSDTPGFKKILMSTSPVPFNYPNGSLGAPDPLAFCQTSGPIRQNSDGIPLQTSQPLDLALQGEGTFMVRTPQGMIPTRNGKFRINTEGMLVNREGHLVQGEPFQNIPAGDIKMDGNGEIKINAMGEITMGGKAVGRLALQKEDGSLVADDKRQIMQGWLESSNVNPVQEMIKILEVTRAFGNYTKLMNGFGDIEKKLIDEMSKV